jgi:MFS transporter, SP family, sugar:H+ symporter
MRANLTFIVRIVAVATIGGFMFGYDSGVINGTQEGLEQAFNLSKLGVGVTVGSILIGCAVGAFMAGRMADVIGRRNVMLLAAAAFIVSAIGSGAANASIPFILARIIGGLGVGAASVLAPAYISEVTPAGIRGRLSSVQQVMIITGLTAAFLANYVLAGVAGLSTAPLWHGFAAWRWMFWMQVIPATFYLLTLLFIPESPRYLVLKGRVADAKNVLTRLFGADGAEAKVREIQGSLATDRKPSLADLKNPASGRWRRIVWVGIGLAVFQQLVGINVVFYYGAVLWQSVGFAESDALRINVLTGALSILACLAAVSLVDRIGRRPLLLIGSAGMAITLGIMVVCFTSGTFQGGQLQLTPGTGKIALVSAILYTMLFNLSWGPVMWVMLGEMFPNQIRGSALAVAGFAQWFANFLVSVSFPWMAANIGLGVTYSFYALSAAVSFFFVRAMVQETRGRELEQMTG